jgi:hypothetical protein
VVAVRRLLLALLLSAGCAREPRPEQVLEMKAIFSESTIAGELLATWQTGRPDQAGRRPLTLRLTARNRLAERLYVRVGDIRVLAPGGAVPVPGSVDGCLLAGDARLPLFRATVTLADADTAVSGIAVEYTAVPLSERGRAFHREYLRRRRPTLEEIDAELDAFAAAPPCVAIE